MEQKINEVKKIVYVALNFTAGLTDVVAAVRKPDGSALTPAPTFTEQGAGIYTAEYTPDTLGVWQEKVTSATNGDVAIRSYKVVSYNISDVKTDTAAIKTETDKIQTIDDNIDAIKVETDKITVMDTNVASAKQTIEDVETAVNVIDGNVDTINVNTAAIKAKTDNLPTDTSAKLDGIESKIDNIDAAVNLGGYFA